ncbi:calcitonin gene-related peptide type 1 receptor [Puntigrus tetrazona]|uniref:calcitonin gene-related peptide type 1 receptor n=1 Tax=Puntigrus tetrazona TaxID=1606681 RepID=UPI001C8A29DA|nr:calcitonin gene-related peptide type 1 receptor [Puntigrus tetrazona]XP_043088516.1 calcitonin gene-related peptide type 1 receptor [Puntigrus tetrazona]
MSPNASALLLVTALLHTHLCRAEDALVAAMMMSAEQVSDIPESSADLSVTRKQILSAQFECYLKIIYDPPRADPGPYCNRTWDGWLCWEDSAPGTAVQLCPSYFQDFDPAEKVTKVCDSDGQWFHHPESNRLWTNYTQCLEYTKQKLELMSVSYYLVIVGHVLSIVSLLVSICIFSYFKCLSCQRITLHKNMFTSFILNSFATIAWFYFIGDDRTKTVSSQVGCKLLVSIMHYTSCSNYFWMLCEGIYLHTLIIVAVFVGEQQLGWYYLLGWGFPVIPAVLHAVARLLFHDDRCWIMNTNLLYIVHSPIQVALLVNLFFLLNIVRVLITKLRVTHCIESNVYMKAVRATIILVPLLGAHFILVPLVPSGRVSIAVYEFFMNVFAHFQGFLVAVIFCFCNGEVQAALRLKFAQCRGQWKRQHLVTNDSHCNYHTNSSITETSRVTIGLEHAPNGQSNGSVHYSHGSKSCDALESTEI